MLTAQVWAQRSTCMRRNVGAVVAVNGRVVSLGYNGAPPGEPHCDGVNCVPPGQVGCARALHAESNAIRYIPDNFRHVSKTMFTTESPCLACATMIFEHQFLAIYYLNEYRDTVGIKHLIRMRTGVFRMTPAGMIMKKILRGDELDEVIHRD